MSGKSGSACSRRQSGTGQSSRRLVSISSYCNCTDTYVALLVLALVLLQVLGGNADVVLAGQTLHTVTLDLASTVGLRLGVLTLVLSSNASILLANQTLAAVTSALALSVQGNVNLVTLREC